METPGLATGKRNAARLGACAQITDAGLAYLKELKGSQSLCLHGCKQITDAGAAELERPLPALRVWR